MLYVSTLTIAHHFFSCPYHCSTVQHCNVNDLWG